MPEHSHPHAPSRYGRAFAIGVTLNLLFVGVEAVYGVLAHSLALLSDAGHNLSDVAGLLMAWGAIRLSQWQPTQKHTYGFQKTSILAALLNSLLLLVAVGGIAWEAIRRLSHPVAIDTGMVVWVAGLGIVVNGITALLFMGGRKQDLNIRGAFLHMSADALLSSGVAAAGLLVAATGWLWIDPVVSLAIGLTIMAGTWGLLRESTNLVLDAVPEGIDPDAVLRFLREQPNVADVHHLHIWSLSTTQVALTAHLVLVKPALDNEWLDRLHQELHEHHGIMHATLQLESPDNNTCLSSR
ncbi:MAG: cation diffusion facilitator family transporter [bacterium]